MAGTEPPAVPPERFEPLVEREGVLIERITSFGNTTPPDRPYRQDRAEWVSVVEGAARIRLEGDPDERSLGPGDDLLIPAGRRHWVTHTANPTVWIAVHLPPAADEADRVSAATPDR